jgi:hypothetical protein
MSSFCEGYMLLFYMLQLSFKGGFMIKINHLGRERELSYWAKFYGIEYAALYARYSRHGANPDKLFKAYNSIKKPQKGRMVRGITYESIGNKMFTYEGKEQSLYRWAEELGIKYKVLEMRVRRGKGGIDLFKPPREWIPMKMYKG